jgi:hypothetical protein
MVNFASRRAAVVARAGLLGAAVAAAFALFWVWRAPSSRATATVVELAAIRPSRFLNTAPEVGYVGADRCAECHPREAQTYLQTAHRHAFSSTQPDVEPADGEFVHEASHRSYQIERVDGRLWHREFHQTPDGAKRLLAAHPADYTIGSGHFSRSYLMNLDGFLVQSPITWYAARPGWAISPGYDRHNPGFERPIVATCLNCHVGRAEVVPNTLQSFQIHTQSIDCERCHGPGALHAERHVRGRHAAGEFDATIVNPARLTRQEQEDVCAQCHFHSGATVELRGRRLQDFRPGLQLNDFCVHVGRTSGNDEMRVVGHVEQLHQSRCYQQSQLTCTTCHHPHQPLAVEERVSFYRAQCLSCHAEPSCKLPREERLRRGAQDDCASCHMPRADTEIPHFALTHHRIGIQRTESDTPSVGPSRLIALDDVSHLPELERDRCLGLGSLQLLQTVETPQDAAECEDRAREMLLAVRRAGLSDPEVDAALARLHWRRDPAQTMEFAQAVLSAATVAPEARVTALFTLGSTYLDRQRPQEALPLLQQLVAARRNSEDWFLLSLCWQRLGQPQAALSAAERAAEISPQMPQLQSHLAQLHIAAGDERRADEHRRRARELQHSR